MKITMLNTLIIFLIAVSAMAQNTSEKKDDTDGDRFNASIGFRCHYAWWDPVWSKVKWSKIGTLMGGVGTDNTVPNGSNFQYNPILSLQFNSRWSLSGSYAYSHYEIDSSAYGISDAPTLFKVRHKNLVDKHDADLLLNFAINRWIKLVFGPKYQGYIIEDKVRTYATSSPLAPLPSSDKIRFHSIGAGLGLGFTVPLGADFYLFPGISAIVLVGRDFAQASNPLNVIISAMLSGIDQAGYKTFVLAGGTGTLALAYHIRAIHLTIEAGGRCQFLYYTEKPRNNIAQDYDLFFGPYLGVTYSFR